MADSENRTPAAAAELAVSIAESVRLVSELAAQGRTAEVIGRAVILSKAFLLAEDSKIKDPAILHQIRRNSE